MSDTALLRIGIAVAFVILVAVILFSSRKKPEQGVRTSLQDDGASKRMEPTLKDLLEAEESGETLSGEHANDDSEKEKSGYLDVGARPHKDFDKVVSLLLAARAGQTLQGPDLVVAAEKAGLIYGHRNIFHRMVDKSHEQGPIFSVANLVQPGIFDLRTIKELKTPGIHFFITLPGPTSALDAWDAMLPTAQRMAELLDAVVLDDQRNALGRQRISHIREELRTYDRQREKLNIKPGR
ncbi:MAG TPA: cell division protein ZipA [Arenimonas sp.]|nr:cell division protein ZipA [Arenimonas sp.]HOZ05654.1 cell division protein ZipA [Arenimonas sp.]HPW31983.1 cell division protein ZipA [Arenimonas sp.]